MSGQQISAFALQIGDLPSNPSSAATTQFHPCPTVPSVVNDMQWGCRNVVYLRSLFSWERNAMFFLLQCIHLYNCVAIHIQEQRKKEKLNLLCTCFFHITLVERDLSLQERGHSGTFMLLIASWIKWKRSYHYNIFFHSLVLYSIFVT